MIGYSPTQSQSIKTKEDRIKQFEAEEQAKRISRFSPTNFSRYPDFLLLAWSKEWWGSWALNELERRKPDESAVEGVF